MGLTVDQVALCLRGFESLPQHHGFDELTIGARSAKSMLARDEKFILSLSKESPPPAPLLHEPANPIPLILENSKTEKIDGD
jgi:hypothetical protein